MTALVIITVIGCDVSDRDVRVRTDASAGNEPSDGSAGGARATGGSTADAGSNAKRGSGGRSSDGDSGGAGAAYKRAETSKPLKPALAGEGDWQGGFRAMRAAGRPNTYNPRF